MHAGEGIPLYGVSDQVRPPLIDYEINIEWLGYYIGPSCTVREFLSATGPGRAWKNAAIRL
jgi:hypothetical protein